ncbi:hypothetical protein AVEN_174826-1 [Araneus ventricosus]|uniref:Uncharacterized protein n=1 Tax=Araneus ventricosus TaxID=182803 RepID=A0A4Y2JKM8_ARAVE|nr:hypothetical protein AVEN_174826-1 [Araneus ventricosus]
MGATFLHLCLHQGNRIDLKTNLITSKVGNSFSKMELNTLPVKKVNKLVCWQNSLYLDLYFTPLYMFKVAFLCKVFIFEIGLYCKVGWLEIRKEQEKGEDMSHQIPSEGICHEIERQLRAIQSGSQKGWAALMICVKLWTISMNRKTASLFVYQRRCERDAKTVDLCQTLDHIYRQEACQSVCLPA